MVRSLVVATPNWAFLALGSILFFFFFFLLIQIKHYYNVRCIALNLIERPPKVVLSRQNGESDGDICKLDPMESLSDIVHHRTFRSTLHTSNKVCLHVLMFYFRTV
jgi:hypothetical protein